MFQTTIQNSVEIVGIGLHKGNSITMRLEPGDMDTGIVFHRTDCYAEPIPLSPQKVCQTQLATTIGHSKEVSISTIEHLMSAIYAYGIDNINIYVSDNEIPILDGSSRGFCLLLDEAKIAYLEAPKKVMKITQEVIVKDEQNSEKFVKIKPDNTMSFDYTIDFEHPCIRQQNYQFEFSKKSYLEDISKARTFGFLKQMHHLQSIGLAKGADLTNAIGLDDEKVLNPEGLHYPDEFVRHKILDAMGDIAVLGMPIIGKYVSYCGSHHLNHLLSKAILEQQAYEVIYTDVVVKNHQRTMAMSYAFNES